MSRLEATFARLRGSGRRGLVAFVTGGDPDLPRSREVVCAVDAAGADVIEVGVPFSDPVADGPVIERASHRAIKAGATMLALLDLVESVRPDVHAPIVLFTYANPVFRLGLDRFADQAAGAGVDGVLVVDVPIEESTELQRVLGRRSVHQIFLVSPTTSDDRLAMSAARASGFLYAISRLGVTGAAPGLADDAAALIQRLRRRSGLPVAVGFGISCPEDVAAAVRHADAAVVGSALVATVERAAGDADLVEQVAQRVRWLRTGLRRESVALSPSSPAPRSSIATGGERDDRQHKRAEGPGEGCA